MALAKAAPERVMAGCGPMHGLIFSGLDPRRGSYFVDYETYAGASGGLSDADGKDAVRVHVSGAANLPIESVEQEFPLTVERYELVPDTGGPGKFRGGLSTRRRVAIWADEGRLAGRGLRQVRGAPGLFGGGMGNTGSFVLEDENSSTQLPGSFSELAVAPGTTINMITPAGAGYGDPIDRDPDRVLADVLAGKVSAQAARLHNGVAITGGQIDLAETIRLREHLRHERSPLLPTDGAE
jgi:N-methylhydantoinase B